MWKGGWDQCRVLDGTPVCAAEGFGGKAPRVSGPTLHAPPFPPPSLLPPPPTSMEGEWGEVSWAVGSRIACQAGPGAFPAREQEHFPDVCVAPGGCSGNQNQLWGGAGPMFELGQSLMKMSLVRSPKGPREAAVHADPTPLLLLGGTFS